MTCKYLMPAVFLVAVFFTFNLNAQNKKLTLEDIYTNGVYREKGIGQLRWMKDNKSYSMLAYNSTAKGYDIVRYDVESVTTSVLISANQLLPPGAVKPLPIEDYTWSDDNSRLLIFTNTRKVWRYNTRGDYWVLNLANGKLNQVGKGLEEATLMFAKFSPDGGRVAYVSKLNIYVEDMATGKIIQLTKDGGGNIINGTFDWVYEEELDDRDGFRWSPDGKNIAYWQSDTKGVGTFFMINNVDSNYSVPIPLPYPKVGATNSAVKVGVVRATGGKTKWFAIEENHGAVLEKEFVIFFNSQYKIK